MRRFYWLIAKARMRSYAFPKIILFDLDGTLINTMEGFADLAGELIERDYGVPFPQARRNYITTSGIPFKCQLEVMFPKDPRNFEVQKEFERRKLDVFFNMRPDEDTVEAIKNLRKIGIKTIVSSNNYFDFVQRYFAAQPEFVFDEILGYRDGFAKGRDHLNYVVQHFDIAKDDMIFVGDSLHDGDVAKELEIPFIGRIAIRTREEFLEKFPNITCVDKISQIFDMFKEYKQCR